MNCGLLRAVAAALLMVAVAATAAPISVSEAFSLPEAEVEASVAESHPSIAVALAKRLFDAGRKDEAVVWFYIGQLRYRFHLMANPGLAPGGDPALMASLNATIGQAINEWAGGSPRDWVLAIDKALAWDESHPNSITSTTEHAAEWRQVRRGLEALRSDIERNAAAIRETRAKNGLENR
jgi:hypothetical protein